MRECEEEEEVHLGASSLLYLLQSPELSILKGRHL